MWIVTFSIFLIAITLFLVYRKKRFSIFKEVGIPGPEPSLIFGNFIELVRKTPTACEKEWVEKYGKIVGFFFGGFPHVLVADTVLLKQIFVVDFHKFINRPLQAIRLDENPYIDQLVNLHDKRWKEVRTILTPSFTSSKLRKMTVLINKSVDTLVEKIGEMSNSKKAFDIYEMYQMFTMEVIGRTAFGFNTNCQKNPDDNLVNSARAILSGKLSDPIIALPFIFPELSNMWFRIFSFVSSFKNNSKDPFQDMLDSLKVVIKSRRQNQSEKRNDLLQSMLDVRMDVSAMNDVKMSSLEALDSADDKIDSDAASKELQRVMTDNEILGNSLLFLVAGYETTSSALAFTTHCLIHHQEIQDRLREEINSIQGEINFNAIHELPYLDQVFNEALRIFPPIYSFTSREAAEDITYDKLRLKKGMAVLSPTNFLHHSPEFWEEPEKFNPDRFSPENKANINPMAFQPFGVGPRNCIGMRVAKTTAKLALCRIFKHYRLVPCEGSDSFPAKVRVANATQQPENGVLLKAMPV